MFKVGEYYEDEAKSVAGYLRDAGFKVDIKGLVKARTDITASLQGRQSELKGKIDAFERYERFLAAIKSAVEKGATQESFSDLFLTILDPSWKDKREKFKELQDSSEEVDEEPSLDVIESIAEWVVAMDFAEKVVEINDIKLGEPMNGRLDDPLISIPVNPADYEPEDSMLRERVDVDLVKTYEISIDEFYTPLFQKIDEEFGEKYHEEYLQIMALGLLIDDLVDEPSEGKVDIEDFAERCILDFGDKDILSIDASLVAEEVARSLEKNGIIKMKGSTIKWRS
jgi:hypothetical protein